MADISASSRTRTFAKWAGRGRVQEIARSEVKDLAASAASAAMPTRLHEDMAQPPPPGGASPAGRAGRRGSIRRLSIVRRESTAGAAEAAGDADVCLMCFKQIPEDAEYCPLDDARPDDGPKVHVECWEPFFADTASTKCKWCFKPVIAPKPTVSATQGGGSRAIPGRGPLLGSGTVAFHQQCVDKWQEKFGNKCAFCGKAVVEGVFVEGAGMTHKGFCCAPPAQFGAQFGANSAPFSHALPVAPQTRPSSRRSRRSGVRRRSRRPRRSGRSLRARRAASRSRRSTMRCPTAMAS